jgi:Putative bacterial sensory transduction regulator
MTHFEKVKHYLMELNYAIIAEDTKEALVVIEKEDEGIKNMVVDCEEPILILEQFIFEIKNGGSVELFKSLLKKNREIVHGAFVLDDSGTKVLFRDTLQLETLDVEELEASLSSLTLLLNEYYDDIITFAHN